MLASAGRVQGLQPSWRVRLCSSFRSLPRPTARPRFTCGSASGEPGGEGGSGSGSEEVSAEKLFQQELERRKAAAAQSPGRNPFAAPQAPPSFGRDPETPPQLLQSRALNSEGLEGLIPRATELIKLGASSVLAFGPFIVAVAIAFGLLYSVFGDAFVHGGTVGSGPPPYVDPDLLLQEGPPMVPFTEGVY